MMSFCTAGSGRAWASERSTQACDRPRRGATSAAAALERGGLALRWKDTILTLCGASPGVAHAAMLGLPAVGVAKTLTIAPEGGTATVGRELEGGVVATTSVTLPALVTVQTGINAPRYVTLRAIKEAERQPIAVHEAAPVAPHARIRRVLVPERVGGAEMIAGDADAVAARIVEIVRGSAR